MPTSEDTCPPPHARRSVRLCILDPPTTDHSTRPHPRRPGTLARPRWCFRRLRGPGSHCRGRGPPHAAPHAVFAGLHGSLGRRSNYQPRGSLALPWTLRHRPWQHSPHPLSPSSATFAGSVYPAPLFRPVWVGLIRRVDLSAATLAPTALPAFFPLVLSWPPLLHQSLGPWALSLSSPCPSPSVPRCPTTSHTFRAGMAHNLSPAASSRAGGGAGYQVLSQSVRR